MVSTETGIAGAIHLTHSARADALLQVEHAKSLLARRHVAPFYATDHESYWADAERLHTPSSHLAELRQRRLDLAFRLARFPQCMWLHVRRASHATLERQNEEEEEEEGGKVPEKKESAQSA
jgi:hypothetical protein